MSPTILLVEDDPSIAEMVRAHLKKDGFNLMHAADGEKALQLFTAEAFDLVLLDLMLPGLDGLDFLKKVREKSFIPVLIVSAKDSEIDKALGLGFGADDYLTKPYSLIELSARIKAALRRANQYSQTSSSSEPALIHIHQLILDSEHFRVSKNGPKLN